MKKLIFFTANDLSNVGGGERVLSLISAGLSQKYHITIITPYNSEPYFDCSGSVSIMKLGLEKSKYSIIRKFQLINVTRRIIKIINAAEYDYFIASSSIAIIITSLVSWDRPNSRLYAWMHTSIFDKEPYLLKKFLLATLYKFHVISINTLDVGQYLLHTYQVSRIANPVPFKTLYKSTTITKRIISVGRLSKPKGFSELIKICADVFRNIDNWVLDIYGQDDGERTNLLRLIKSEGMENRIQIHDPTANICQKLLNSSVFAFCSLIECFPLSLLEACECGLPCIAYNSPSGIRDIIKDGYNGYLIEQDDRKTFAESLTTLLKNDDLRKEMGINASQYVKQFSQDCILQQWYKLLC